jgi:hypothetical protein
MPGKKPRSTRESIRFDDYSHFVLTRLVRIKGNSPSEVGAFIVREWIGEHFEELDRYGITPKAMHDSETAEGEV